LHADAATISILRAAQAALDLAQQRIRDLETANATMAGRLAAANERADRLELALAATAMLDANA